MVWRKNVSRPAGFVMSPDAMTMLPDALPD